MESRPRHLAPRRDARAAPDEETDTPATHDGVRQPVLVEFLHEVLGTWGTTTRAIVLLVTVAALVVGALVVLPLSIDLGPVRLRP
ncbi:hypothetical protein [Saccharothrix sp. Mg75]|uniref:hypothetical protein n=1 Tax=Saccharothrix sp. Mg75 TaxID=3445357 RepID=UPI003EE9A36C